MINQSNYALHSCGGMFRKRSLIELLDDVKFISKEFKLYP
jgi:hypothetical protein